MPYSQNVSALRARFPHTIPVWPVDDEGYCTCYFGTACKRPGKHADEQAPEDSPAYAVLCGPGGVLAIDVDVKGGVDGFKELERWELPTTLEVHTPSGGRHLFYKHPGVELTNRKLARAIDVRANKMTDEGYAYVIGPGSPGYVKTSDPCRVEPAEPYEIAEDEPIADAPADLVAFLSIDAKGEGAPVEAIHENHPAWALVLRLFEEDCKTMPPSIEDGQGSANLMAVVRRGARRYQLPPARALEVINEHWNSRCTKSDGKTPYPWDAVEILRALERSQANGPGEGMADTLLARENGTDIAHKMRKHFLPKSIRDAGERMAELKERMAKTREPRGVVAGMTHTGDRKSLTKDQLVHALYLSPEWKDVLWYDVLRRRPFAVKPPIDAELSLERGSGMSKTDRALIAHWFATRGEDVRTEHIDDAVNVVTAQRDRQKNALAEYLDSLELATDSHVLDTLATDVFGAKAPFANLLMKKHLVGAALRARRPGAPHKGMLVLKGKQGCGKTPSVRILAGEGRYYTTGNGDITADWTLLACAGNWLVEVEEMSAAKRDVESLKTAISRHEDTPNVKFEPNPQPYPRSFVFIATTNKESFLNDTSGDARYWVVEVGKVDLAKLQELRDRIWAEADYLARTMPERWNYLTEEEERQLAEGQQAFRKDDPFLEPLRAFLAGKRVADIQLAWSALGQQSPLPEPREQDRIEGCFQVLGCVKRSRNGDQPRPRIGKRRPSTWWEVPASLTAEASDVAPAVQRSTTGPAGGPS